MSVEKLHLMSRGWQPSIRIWICGICLSAASVLAGNDAASAGTSSLRWSLYVGRHTDTRFVDILRGDTDFQDSYVGVVMVTRQVADWPPYAEWDAEAGAARHWGMQQHVEVNAAIMLRVIPWPEAANWRLTAGLGIGPSWASATPRVERAREGRTARRLLFMPFEVTVAPVDSDLALCARVHHRSGGFDVFSRGRGSNFLGLGARRTW